jgi:hypothetical protein
MNPMTANIISTETKRWCERGNALPKGSEQFLVNDKHVPFSNCWTVRARSY